MRRCGLPDLLSQQSARADNSTSSPMRVLSLITITASLSFTLFATSCDDEQLFPDAKDSGNRVFDTSALHEIAIEVDDAHLASLDEDTDTRVPCAFTFDGERIEGAGCKKKGQTTLRPLDEKPSFSV